MLTNWNFQNPETNGSTSLVNRQKSARNLVVVELDRERRTAVFYDPQKKHRQTASLSTCDCRDFSFVGKSPRKTYQPCMHVYRLAMELGMLEAKYEDHGMREMLERRRVTLLKEAEDLRLRSLPRDLAQWGRWSREVHESGLQRNRQYRAYFILEDERDQFAQEGGGWRIHDYLTYLDACECADFADRSLPCKHIYAVALVSRINLPLALSDYRAARAKGLEILFAYDE